MKPKRLTHDYTNEVELKSLLMREKNNYDDTGTESLNLDINSLITEYKNNKTQELKTKIIEMSKITRIDKTSHEIFGSIILLMIHKILTKPNFSGYSWRDDFFSTACYRVFKYLHNFDYNKKSERTGVEVSAFSYITQIITMSILEVINRNNKHSKELEEYSNKLSRDFGLEVQSIKTSDIEIENQVVDCIIDYSFDKLSDAIQLEIKKNNGKELKIYYPKEYKITYDEYAIISEILKTNEKPVSLLRLNMLEAGAVED